MRRRTGPGRRPKRREERQSRVIAVRLTPAEFDDLSRRTGGLPPATFLRGLAVTFLEAGLRIDSHERRVEELQRRHEELQRAQREAEERAKGLHEEIRRLGASLDARREKRGGGR